ncbi:hypothetical protein BD413DRAFT_649394 [Trametes elegans]|nr:hypothetical protein BD413DRAFT_649394 [Trametes elegans]
MSRITPRRSPPPTPSSPRFAIYLKHKPSRRQDCPPRCMEASPLTSQWQSQYWSAPAAGNEPWQSQVASETSAQLGPNATSADTQWNNLVAALTTTIQARHATQQQQPILPHNIQPLQASSIPEPPPPSARSRPPLTATVGTVPDDEVHLVGALGHAIRAAQKKPHAEARRWRAKVAASRRAFQPTQTSRSLIVLAVLCAGHAAGGAENRAFSDAKRVFFIHYLRWRLAEDDTLDKEDLYVELAELVSHHDVDSWKDHWSKHPQLPEKIFINATRSLRCGSASDDSDAGVRRAAGPGIGSNESASEYHPAGEYPREEASSDLETVCTTRARDAHAQSPRLPVPVTEDALKAMGRYRLEMAAIWDRIPIQRACWKAFAARPEVCICSNWWRVVWQAQATWQNVKRSLDAWSQVELRRGYAIEHYPQLLPEQDQELRRTVAMEPAAVTTSRKRSLSMPFPQGAGNRDLCKTKRLVMELPDGSAESAFYLGG